MLELRRGCCHKRRIGLEGRVLALLLQMFVVFIVGTKLSIRACVKVRPFYTAATQSNAVAVIGQHCCCSQMTLT